MAFDKLYYFEKTPTLSVNSELKHKRYEFGEIQTTFNMSFVLDGTKDSCKVEVYNNNSKELDPLTICWLESTNTWWVVKSDKVTRYANEIGAYYQHSISLYGAFEILNARDLTNCGFNANRYTLNEFLARLETMMDFEYPITWDFGTYADTNQTVTYLKTFQNYTPMSAIRELFDGMNLVAKLTFVTATSGDDTYISSAKITAYSKSGSVAQPLSISTFNNEEEQCSSDIESFGTRVISNVQNCVSADPIRYPAIGGTKVISDEPTVTASNCFLRLPSDIYKVNKIIISRILYVECEVGPNYIKTIEINPLNYTKETLLLYLKNVFSLTDEQWETFENDYYDAFYNAFSTMGEYELNNGGVYNKIDDTWSQPYLPIQSEATGEHGTQFEITLNDKAHGTSAIYNQKWSMYWEQGNDKIESFGWLDSKATALPNANQVYAIYFDPVQFEIRYYRSYGYPEYFDVSKTRFAVEYVPMADLKVKVDNNKEQNDSNLYNQNGKLVDSVAISKLINSHAKEISSNEITRYKTYRYYQEIPQISQVVDNNGEKYVINNISIDFYENDDNHYFMQCQFTMTKQVGCKSTMISANTNIRDYDCPQQNNVPRIQVYRDYLELDYEEEHNETPYLALEQVLSFSATTKGLVDNHTCVFSVDGTYFYQIGTSKFNLNKQFVEVADFKDNNIIGYEAGKSYQVVQVQTLLDRKASDVNTPISYVDTIGELESLKLLYCDALQLETAYEQNNATEIIGKFVQVPSEVWTYINTNQTYDILIDEPNYDKDGLEVPIFEYACQVGDNNDIIFGADFLKGESGIRIDYKVTVVDNVYITQENATAYFQNSYDATLTYDDGELALAISGNSADFKDKSLVVYCNIYGSVSGVQVYKGEYTKDGGVSTNDGTQTFQLQSHGSLSTFILTSAETYQLDNPYGGECYVPLQPTATTSFIYYVTDGTGGEFYATTVTLKYQTTKLVVNTISATQNVSITGTPITAQKDIGQNGVTYNDGTVTRIVTENKTKNYNVSGYAGTKSGSYYYTQYMQQTISEIGDYGATLSYDGPFTNVTVNGNIVNFRLRSSTQDFVSGTITASWSQNHSYTFYKYSRELIVTDYESGGTISQNNIANDYGITNLSNTLTVTEISSTAHRINIVVWSDSSTMSYSASYNYATGYYGSFNVQAEHNNVDIDSAQYTSSDPRDSLECYYDSSTQSYYFRGTIYKDSGNDISRTISYTYKEVALTVLDHSVDLYVTSGDTPRTYDIPSDEGTLYGQPTIEFTYALVDPYITIESFDTDTGEITYIAGDHDSATKKVGVRIKWTEWYRDYGLQKQEFLFAVNKCKVSGTNSLTLKVNNWKLK